MKKIRQVLFYKHYFEEFFNRQNNRVKDKINEVLFVVCLIERVPQKFLKFIENTDGLYEIRVEVGNDIFRIFSCFDEGRLVVLFNGFQKKSQKIPRIEIEKAEKLKSEYFEQKKAKRYGDNY